MKLNDEGGLKGKCHVLNANYIKYILNMLVYLFLLPNVGAVTIFQHVNACSERFPEFPGWQVGCVCLGSHVSLPAEPGKQSRY